MGVVKNEDIFTASKSWGSEFILKLTPLYTVKSVTIDAGKSTRKKTYRDKEETWVITAGDGSVNIGGTKVRIKSGDTIHIEPEKEYFFSAGQMGMTAIIASTPELWED